MKKIIRLCTLAICLMMGIEFGMNGTFLIAQTILGCAIAYIILHIIMTIKSAKQHQDQDRSWNSQQQGPNPHITRYEWDGFKMVGIAAPLKVIHPLWWYIKKWWGWLG